MVLRLGKELVGVFDQFEQDLCTKPHVGQRTKLRAEQRGARATGRGARGGAAGAGGRTLSFLYSRATSSCTQRPPRR